MNYTVFMERVERFLDQCTLDGLRERVHELARTMDEKDRDHFLEIMKICGDPSMPGDEADQLALRAQVQEMIHVFETLDKEGRTLEKSDDEDEYDDDWYDEEEDDVEFEDPHGIIEDIRRAFDLLHTCALRGAFEDGRSLAVTLRNLHVTATGEYSKEDVSLSHMVQAFSLTPMYKQYVLDAAFMELMSCTDDGAVEAVYDLLMEASFACVTLEDILQHAPREIDVLKFLPPWMERLGKDTSGYADTLLQEASGLLNSEEKQLEAARKYASYHPTLYRVMIQNKWDAGDAQSVMELGLQALSEIPQKQEQRSRIALLTASAALKLGDEETVRKCWLETFLSCPTPVHFLRLNLLTEDDTWYKGKVTTRIKRSIVDDRPLLLFLNGQFEDMITQFMSGKFTTSSSARINYMTALLILLIAEGPMRSPSMNALLRSAESLFRFRKEDYQKGTRLQLQGSEEDVFREVFMQWKAKHPAPQAVTLHVLSQMETWLSVYIASVMDACRYDEYDECACLLAGYADALTSLGLEEARDQMIQNFRAEYSCKRKLKACLSHYGVQF